MTDPTIGTSGQKFLGLNRCEQAVAQKNCEMDVHEFCKDEDGDGEIDFKSRRALALAVNFLS